MNRTLLVVAIVACCLWPLSAHARRPGTAESARLRGLATVIRSQGRAARSQSRANINNEEARSRYIDNQLKWTETYFAKRDINRRHVEEESARRRSKTQNYLANRGSQAPPRLSFSVFDPSTGQIEWPDGLQAPEYAAAKSHLESLFSLRAQTQSTAGTTTPIRDGVESLRGELRKHIDELAPSEYLTARKFLDSLTYEGTLPAG